MTNFKRSSNNTQETRKIKKILNEEIRLGINAASDSESEEVDLKKELFPLAHYINDREEMIEQMFSIIKGEKLKKMLPPILRDIPLDEIKADCLIHLLGMSTKRIMATLDGREIYSSSDSETNSNSSSSPSKKSKLELKPFMIKQEGCSDISDNSEEVVLVEPDAESSRSTKGSKLHKKRHKHKKKNFPEKIHKTKKKILQEKLQKTTDMINESHAISTGSDDDEADSPKEEKSLLEMLELEMRRRAIRALLDKEGNNERENKNNNLEEEAQSTGNISEKTKNLNKTDKSSKITPAKNFRTKKHKNDDVIVIVPKLVTIDLTDENKTSKISSSEVINEANNEEAENFINSIKINTDKEKDQLNMDSHNTDNSEESSNTSETKSDAEVEGSKAECTVVDEVIDIPDSLEQNKTQDNKEKEQPNQDKIVSGKEEQPNSNWALRWLDSKDVKKVVSTSKICGNIRKKIKSAKLAKKTLENLPKDVVETPEIHGSVIEYQSLPKSSTTLAMPTETSAVNNTEDNCKSFEVKNIDENQTAVNLKEPTLVVEQVQDVSSTKSEVSVLTSTKDQMSDIPVNETLTSNSDDIFKEDEVQKLKNLESELPKQVEISESNANGAINSNSVVLEIDTTPKLTDDEMLNINQELNIFVENGENVPICNQMLESGVANNLGSQQVESDQTESDNVTTHVPNFKEFESSSKIEPSQHYESPDDESDNLKSDNNTDNEESSNLVFINETSNSILDQDSSSCNAKKSPKAETSYKSTEHVLSSAETLSTTQEIGNDHEALEINITEEDREIE